MRVLNPDNWTVLADLQGDDLAALHEFHKFDPELHAIVAPAGAAPAADPEHTPVAVSVEAADGVGGQDVMA